MGSVSDAIAKLDDLRKRTQNNEVHDLIDILIDVFQAAKPDDDNSESEVPDLQGLFRE